MELLSFLKLKMELSILKIILYIFIPFGPLYARIVDLNGTLDHPWTMFPVFNVFPFSIIPVLMIAFGAIKKGNGSKPYDIFMIIPIVCRIIFILIINWMMPDYTTLKSLIVLFISIISIMIPNIIRRYENCKDRPDKDNNSYSILNGKQWYRTFVDSYFELGFSEIFIIMINFVPFVGIGFKILSMLPFVGGFLDNILWLFGFISGYVIINMYNQANMDDMCYPEVFNTSNEIARLIMGFVFFVLSYIVSLFTLKGIKNKAMSKVINLKNNITNVKENITHIKERFINDDNNNTNDDNANDDNDTNNSVSTIHKTLKKFVKNTKNKKNKKNKKSKHSLKYEKK